MLGCAYGGDVSVAASAQYARALRLFPLGLPIDIVVVAAVTAATHSQTPDRRQTTVFFVSSRRDGKRRFVSCRELWDKAFCLTARYSEHGGQGNARQGRVGNGGGGRPPLFFTSPQKQSVESTVMGFNRAYSLCTTPDQRR